MKSFAIRQLDAISLRARQQYTLNEERRGNERRKEKKREWKEKREENERRKEKERKWKKKREENDMKEEGRRIGQKREGIKGKGWRQKMKKGILFE